MKCYHYFRRQAVSNKTPHMIALDAIFMLHLRALLLPPASLRKTALNEALHKRAPLW